jgi:cyanobactin maturation PatA/PatG family protease
MMTIIPSYDDPAPLKALGNGDPRILIAVLDGPIDASHPCFDGARLTVLQTAASLARRSSEALAHGTHVTSVIFGQPGSPVPGIAPLCHGLIVPIFAGQAPDGSLGCSQLDLARAILLAVENGADIINVSGRQLTPSTEPEPALAQAISRCVERKVLIVAAAGDDGCDCLHGPAALAAVLAVGGADHDGNPLPSSNRGPACRTQGILAPGIDVLGAVAGSRDAARRTGTSFATPIVSGVAGLLAARQLALRETSNTTVVRDVLLRSAVARLPTAGNDCPRFLAGSLNIQGAAGLIEQGDQVMSNQPVAAPLMQMATERT